MTKAPDVPAPESGEASVTVEWMEVEMPPSWVAKIILDRERFQVRQEYY